MITKAAIAYKWVYTKSENGHYKVGSLEKATTLAEGWVRKIPNFFLIDLDR